MSRIVEFPDHSTIEREAAAWVARLDAGALSRESLQALRRWALQSPHHRSALEEIAESWDMLDVLALARPAERVSRGFGRRWQSVAATLAAGLAVVALAIGVLRTQGGDAPAAFDPANVTYFTAIGEQRSVVLPDLSSVRINTNSRLQVDYSAEQRSIFLQQGEAFFNVAKSARPFVVTAGRGQVAAVGTAFAIRLSDNNVVKVDVTEGSVAILIPVEPSTADSREDIPPRVFFAGDVALIGDSIELVQTVEPEILERQLSWREGMLIFDGDPLESVIAEVSRYTSVEIVIADPSLRSLKIGGYFRTGDTEVLLATLASNFGIEADYIRPGLIYLRPLSR